MFEITTLLPLIPALPLASTLLTAALGKRVLKSHSHWPTILAFAGSFLLALMLLIQVNRGASVAEHAADDQGTADIAPSVSPLAGDASQAPATSTVGFEVVRSLWTWANVNQALGNNNFRIEVTLRADPLTSIMLVMVTFVATLVAIYAAGYMHDDPGYWRFFTYVSLFVFSMTMLVSVSNFALLFVFWEAVGVCSYLLIGFWFQKPEAAAAGKKAFLVNRIGDFGFTLGVFLIWTTFGTLDFHDSVTPAAATSPAKARTTVATAEQAPAQGNVVHGVLGQHYLSTSYAQLPNHPLGGSKQTLFLAICLLLFVGSCGKSAQFPLHVWLPDAMEGPTPVSALIHAATMVTAGVYLVARTAPLFLESQSAYYVVAIVGGFTALMAALIAVTQTDLKRVLAYSTVSQLGYMFLALGTCTLAGYTAAMFHLFSHAFFKALLFLGAGSVMHAMGGVIDMRHFSGLRRLMPWTHWTFLIGSLALSGIFPFSGFWSKDAILGAAHDGGPNGPAPIFTVLYYVGLFAAFLTAFYTFRAFFMTFYGQEEIPPEAGHHAHESPRNMTIPLAILAVFAAGVWMFATPFADLLGHTPSLAYAGIRATGPAEEFHMSVAITSTIIAVCGVGLSALLYLKGGQLLGTLTGAAKTVYVYQLSHGKFFFDQIYAIVILGPIWVLAYVCAFVDRLLVDGLVNLLGWIPKAIGALLRPLQIGLVQFYALAMVLGVLVLIGSLLW